jgi:hypothetical protein
VGEGVSVAEGLVVGVEVRTGEISAVGAFVSMDTDWHPISMVMAMMAIMLALNNRF